MGALGIEVFYSQRGFTWFLLLRAADTGNVPLFMSVSQMYGITHIILSCRPTEYLGVRGCALDSSLAFL